MFVFGYDATIFLFFKNCAPNLNLLEKIPTLQAPFEVKIDLLTNDAINLYKHIYMRKS